MLLLLPVRSSLKNIEKEEPIEFVNQITISTLVSQEGQNNNISDSTRFPGLKGLKSLRNNLYFVKLRKDDEFQTLY